MRPAKSLIFDLDGTLVDTLGRICYAINRALDRDGLSTLMPKEVADRVGFGGSSLVEYGLLKSGRSADPEHIARLQAHYWDEYLAAPIHATRVWPGVIPMLKRVSAQGVDMSICTNKAGVLASAIIDGFGLTDYFSNVVCGDTLPYRKPHAGPIEWIMKQVSVTAGECIMIGDTEHDVLAAKNAGIRSIFVSFGYSRLESLETLPDFVINHFDDIEQALHNIGYQLSSSYNGDCRRKSPESSRAGFGADIDKKIKPSISLNFYATEKFHPGFTLIRF